MKTKKNVESPITGCRTTKIYCLPGCPPGRRTKPENRVHFKSRDEARSKGFRACKVCKPDGPNPVPETFYTTTYDSPLGPYLLVSSEQGVAGVKSDGKTSSLLARWEKSGIRIKPGSGHKDTVARELDVYFAGKLRRFTVPLDLRGTDFQLSAWEQLSAIPYGETRSYGQIAEAMGRPSASRAVGRANNTNPVAIIVPCHRVIGADGKLVGYAGGLEKKQALLDLEAGVVNRI